jgi:hypothetical protein
MYLAFPLADIPGYAFNFPYVPKGDHRARVNLARTTAGSRLGLVEAAILGISV